MCQKYEYYILDDDSTILRVPIDSEGKKNIFDVERWYENEQIWTQKYLSAGWPWEASLIDEETAKRVIRTGHLYKY